jgi:hypothetical protein
MSGNVDINEYGHIDTEVDVDWDVPSPNIYGDFEPYEYTPILVPFPYQGPVPSRNPK